MTVFGLQIVAMLTMFLDHLGIVFFNDNIVLRTIGRFAFPIYAFLIAETFRHIKNDAERVMKHLGSYVVLALVSELSYDLMEFDLLEMSVISISQNAVITLILGFIGLIAIDKWQDKPLFMWSTIFLTAFMNYYVKSNYKFAGVLLIYGFYYYLNKMDKFNYLKRLLFLISIFATYLPVYHWARYEFCNLSLFLEKLGGNNMWWYSVHILIAMLLAGYSGKLGRISWKHKKIFKYFYPVHMLVLGLLRRII